MTGAGTARAGQRVPRALTTLVALLTLVTLELVRSSGPLLDMAFALGVEVAAVAALATYLMPGVLAVLLLAPARRRGVRLPVAAGAIALAAARLAVQGVEAGARFAVGLSTVALAIAVLTVTVAVLAGRPGGGRAVAGAMVTGAAAATGLQLSLGTWDAYWRPGVVGWGIATALAVALVLAGLLAARDPGTPPSMRPARLWALGPTLALAAMMLANPAFAASQSGLTLAVAGPVAAGGLLLSGWVAALGLPSGWGGRAPVTVLVPLLLAGAVAGVMWTTGPLVLVLLVLAQVLAAAALALALEPRVRATTTTGPPAGATVPVRVAGSACLVGLGTILPLLVFQLDYDLPLGFPNVLTLVATAALLGAAALHRGVATGRATQPGVGWLLIGATALVVAGSALTVGGALSTSRAVARAALDVPTDIRLVSWNLHYGVDGTGGVDLEAIARTLEEQEPTVITLQEVSRGWVMGAGSDTATWLANRLGMRMHFAPAADRQFGNAILTALPVQDVSVLALPYGVGPQNRSALSADVLLPDGVLRVTSVHLQHRETSTPTRLAQIRTLLAAEGDTPVAVIAGDLNAEPGWPEIDALLGAGLTSAQDTAGDPDALTSPSLDPRYRIDWVLTRGVVVEEALVLDDAHSSDHLPLSVLLRLEPSAPPG
ncbi:endonuclease/exonuclease/phosphatase family protein [Actinotalea sp. K2]|uniref:endonuclease/exonuclease/phosphatase family protein n=1 Tax=Actinotalea sp. K2 TaxID=2939438 RepID=UPI0020171A08|nr:endonuclease/exonuclease/phosphatase family protein [Actinotalea sp. K2]MCL3862631.1 endonuclease/exonuclease/phosphatase family protein [Actinotalea sp. K2]